MFFINIFLCKYISTYLFNILFFILEKESEAIGPQSIKATLVCCNENLQPLMNEDFDSNKTYTCLSPLTNESTSNLSLDSSESFSSESNLTTTPLVQSSAQVTVPQENNTVRNFKIDFSNFYKIYI